MKDLIKTGAAVFPDEPMSGHTTLGIGGPAQWYVEVSNMDQLRALMRVTRDKKLPVFFLGYGSDLVVSDQGIEGVVIRLREEFETVSFEGLEVRVGAGVFLPNLVKQCADRGLSGAEPLVGVPGSVGGALMMNAGTRDLEIGAIVKTVEILNPDGNLELLNSNQVRFQYRWSSLAGSVVCFATLELKRERKDVIMRTIQEFLEKRLSTQPVGTMNVGSIFKNPKGYFAAQLIEKAGLKGLKKGNAQVSPKHANFIVNCGGATAQNVRDLVLEIQTKIDKKFGVKLEPEIKIVGRE